MAITATFTQVDTEGNLRQVVFESSCLTEAEQAYPAHKLELLAVVHALSVWRNYLLESGVPRQSGDLTNFTQPGGHLA